MILLLSINLNPGKSYLLTWVFSFHQFRSIQFSHSVVSDSLQPLWAAAHQASLSITNSQSSLKLMSTGWWCHPTISSSVVLLLLPSIFPTIRVFSYESVLCIRRPKYWVSASAPVLPKNIQGWFPLRWTGWISLQSKELSRVSQTPWKLCFFPYLELNHQFGSLQILIILY